MKIEAGQVHRVKYPFVRETYDEWGVNGVIAIQGWRPGIRFENIYDGDGEPDSIADADGEMLLEVIDVHKPGKYPERVFYTRKWKDPDGKEFGKATLRMTTTTRFKRLANSYQHDYELQNGEGHD